MKNPLSRRLIGLLSTLLLVSCAGEKSSNEYLVSANTHVESGDLSSALIETRNAVSKDPDNGDARLLLGNLELKIGNPSGAEAELLKAQELGVPDSRLAANLSQSYLLIGKIDELRAIQSNSLNNTDKARLLGYQAEGALIQADLTAAKTLAKGAIDADPASAVALTINARLQMIDNNTPTARTYLAAALDNTPGHSAGWELLGDIETSEQRHPEALIAYTRSLETATNFFSPLFKRIRTHLALNDLESAASDIENLSKSNIDSPAVGLLKGEILLREGNLVDAQFALEEALKNDPGFQPGVRSLAIIHMLRGNLGQAEQFGKQYFSVSDSDDSRILLATIRLEAEQFKQAEQIYLDAEKTAVDADGVVVALVSTSSVGGIKDAYPNFFADSSMFINHLAMVRDAPLNNNGGAISRILKSAGFS